MVIGVVRGCRRVGKLPPLSSPSYHCDFAPIPLYTLQVYLVRLFNATEIYYVIRERAPPKAIPKLYICTCLRIVSVSGLVPIIWNRWGFFLTGKCSYRAVELIRNFLIIAIGGTWQRSAYFFSLPIPHPRRPYTYTTLDEATVWRLNAPPPCSYAVMLYCNSARCMRAYIDAAYTTRDTTLIPPSHRPCHSLTRAPVYRPAESVVRARIFIFL